MASVEGFIAANRFGFGTSPGELERISADPKGWLLPQLDPKFAKNKQLDALRQSIETNRPFEDILRRKNLLTLDEKDPELKARLAEVQADVLQRYARDVSLRMKTASASEAPLFERLVQFWSNHFTVSGIKWGDMPLVVTFERDAIRPHVMGRFEDMLLASTRHPAMLIFLDNIASIGPKSPNGKEFNKGLNENLAREIMELHTLGVDGGYTQDDVTEFSKMLTGWNIEGEKHGDEWGWRYGYNFRQHEPGEKKLLGKTYAEEGENEAKTALLDLARNPATARHIARKLARHFIADTPPEGAVNTLAAAFTESKGQLIPVYKALVGLDEVWQKPLPKLKTPNEYILSILRATGMDPDDGRIMVSARALGQMPFTATSPAGWSDMAKDWMSTESLLQRLGLAQIVAQSVSTAFDPVKLMEETIGPVASEKTRQAVTAAGSAAEAIVLLLASPEFQRR